MDIYNEIQQKIADCRWKLSDSASPIGDWKIAKCYEEKMKKFDIPVVRKSEEE